MTWEKELLTNGKRKQFFLQMTKKQLEKNNASVYSPTRRSSDLLYAFFKNEIDEYIRTGDKQKFEEVLVWAKDNHPYQDENENYIVRLTLSQEIPTQSEGTTTVINGILDELV